MEPIQFVRQLGEWSGPFLPVVNDQVQLPSGSLGMREVLRKVDSVVIVGGTTSNRVLLVCEYRYAQRRNIWSVPGGIIDPGESAEQAARREFEEETGFAAGKMELLGAISAAVWSTEMIHIFRASELRKTVNHEDDDEVLVCREFEAHEAVQLLLDNHATGYCIAAVAMAGRWPH